MREYIDNLTGLYNLFYLKENYNKYIQDKDECYLISIDFKKLKYINDNFGHDAGDKVIITFSNISSEVFEDSLVIRRSGDEFIIATDIQYNEIIQRLKLIVKKISKAYKDKVIPINFEFNSGIKLCENDLTETLYKSDITMYHAKNNNQLYMNYTSDLLIKIKNSENFVNKIDKLIENNLLSYAVQKIFDINGEKSNISQIYSRDDNKNSIFEDEKYEILKTNYRIKCIDFKNIELLIKYVLPMINNNVKYMISIHYDTLLSRGFDLVNYLKNVKNESDYNLKNIILSINISEYNDFIYKVVDKIRELKNMDISICIDNLNFSELDSVIPIVSIIQVEYVNIHKKSLLKAMNEKRYKIVLEYIINLLIELDIIPIFINVDSESEIEFIKNISDKCLIRGNIYSLEEELKKNK